MSATQLNAADLAVIKNLIDAVRPIVLLSDSNPLFQAYLDTYIVSAKIKKILESLAVDIETPA